MQERMGIIHPKDTLFFRQSVGEASRDGKKYELDLTVSGFPLIHSVQSGKWYSVSWEALIDQAISEGLDELEEDDRK